MLGSGMKNIKFNKKNIFLRLQFQQIIIMKQWKSNNMRTGTPSYDMFTIGSHKVRTERPGVEDDWRTSSSNERPGRR